MLQRPFVSARRAATVARSPRVVARAASVSENGAKQTIEFEDLVDVIKAVDSSDVVELELKGKKFALTVKKQEALKAAEPVYVQAAMGAPAMAQAPAPAAAAPAPPAGAPAAAPAAPPAAAKPAPAAVNGVEIVAPMSGTVYRKPAPGEPAFVKEGDKVVKGQTICIIEAMKLMNEIEADISGTMVKFVADDTSNIGPGEVLCIIDPN